MRTIFLNYFLISILIAGLLSCNTSKLKEQYICPPCNSACDDLIFDQAGICPHCQMTLIKRAIETKLSDEKQVDALFQQYDNIASPGAAVGIIKKGVLHYAKGYGSANLDYDIPISLDSKFYIGSMAKQFVGAALLKLETEGKIDFDQPIQKYLPDFPTYEYPIYVRHIIHHTSGIRGTSSMQLIGGIQSDFESYFTAEQQYEMIKNQRILNFIPGTEYRYSSGGYIVLAKVIEGITGHSLRSYLKTYFFDPLGMRNTFVIDDHNEVVKGRVISYFPKREGGFERRSMIFDGKGDGSILTTINDLLQWDKAFYDDALLDIPNFAARMYKGGMLNNGSTLNYGMALQNYEHHGLSFIAHNGGMLGFRADLVRFPKQQFSVIVLANHGNIHSTGMALKIADIYLKEFYLEQKPELDSPTWYPVASEKLKALAGKYFNESTNSWRRISYEQDTLFYDAGSLKYRVPLIPSSEHTFQLPNLNWQLQFKQDTLELDYGSHRHQLVKFDDQQPNGIEELMKYTGWYYSSELNASYNIFREANRLWLRVNNNTPVIIYPDPSDPRINWNSKTKVWIGYAMMKFDVLPNGNVKGFYIGDNRVGGIWFGKTAK